MLQFKRGDTFPFKVKITLADKQPVTDSDISTIFVTCKSNHSEDSTLAFQKTKDDVELDSDGNLHIVIEPKDTEHLTPGIYDFDIEVTLRDGYRKTKTGSIDLLYDITDHKGE
jgi:hypothetical protein